MAHPNPIFIQMPYLKSKAFVQKFVDYANTVGLDLYTDTDLLKGLKTNNTDLKIEIHLYNDNQVRGVAFTTNAHAGELMIKFIIEVMDMEDNSGLPIPMPPNSMSQFLEHYCRVARKLGVTFYEETTDIGLNLVIADGTLISFKRLTNGFLMHTDNETVAKEILDHIAMGEC